MAQKSVEMVVSGLSKEPKAEAQRLEHSELTHMLSGKDKSSFIPNRKHIENFYSTQTVQFYESLFGMLGLGGNPGSKT